MATTFLDIDGDRFLTIDAGDERRPQSVYIFGPQGLAIEFDRHVLLMAAKLELGLMENHECHLKQIYDLEAVA